MRPLPQKVIQGLETKSAKIRALHDAGFDRTEIRDFLKIRYQHVRNVLVQSGNQAGLAKRKVTAPELRRVEAVAWHVEKLLDSGFALLGEWRSTSETSFVLSVRAPKEAGVYAFAVDGLI